MDEDGEISIKLSLREWRLVSAHVEAGMYRDVCPILAAMYTQMNAEIIAANERAIAVAAAERIQTARIAQSGFGGDPAPQSRHPYEQSANPTQEPTADESAEPQSHTQRPALH